MGFEILGLSEGILSAVKDSGYETPTDIQKQAIPHVLMGRDILGLAQTGTGKTASFTLPMIDILSEGRSRARMPRSLILEPTRELAVQVAENFDKYGKNHKLSKALLIGGVNFSDQDRLLDKGVDVLIATPGRLLDHMERGKLMLTGIDILVVDEADRMLDMGFIPDVEKICSKIPKKHQTLFFSATMAPSIERLTKKFLDDPRMIEASKPSSTASTITQLLVQTDGRRKRQVLRNLIRKSDVQNGIIFCNRKKDVKDVYTSLNSHGFSVGELHGDMAQSDRLRVLTAFKANEIQLLCASDVAARGLDIAAVSHVFNFDVPNNAEDYVHRIGRTGRAGREGTAYTIAAKSKVDARLIGAIEKLIGKSIDIEEVDLGGKSESKKSSAKSSKPSKAKEAPEEADNTAPAEDKTDKSTDSPKQSRSDKSERSERPSRAPRRQDRSQGRRNDRNNDRNNDRQRRDSGNYRVAPDDWPKGPVVGMGPHVPAFMLTPLKISK